MKLLKELMEDTGKAYFAYGKLYGRGGTDTLKVKLPIDVMLKAAELAKKDDDDALDKLLSKLHHNVQYLIGIMFDENLDEIVNRIKSGKPFSVEGEEAVYGAAPTPAAAKAAFLKIDDDDDDQWQE